MERFGYSKKPEEMPASGVHTQDNITKKTPASTAQQKPTTNNNVEAKKKAVVKTAVKKVVDFDISGNILIDEILKIRAQKREVYDSAKGVKTDISQEFTKNICLKTT